MKEHSSKWNRERKFVVDENEPWKFTNLLQSEMQTFPVLCRYLNEVTK